MFNNENKEIKLKANTKKVTIEIPTQLLIEIFKDQYSEDECKIKNKKKFREEFVLQIREELEHEILNNICECIADNEECVKWIEE